MRLFIFLLTIISFFILFPSLVLAQKIVFLKTNSSVYYPGDVAYFEALIENEEELIVNHRVEFIIMKTSDWEDVAIPGDTIVYKTESSLNLQPSERKNLEFKWKIPESAEPSIYRAYCVIRSQNGLNKGFMTKLFEIKDVGNEIRAVRIWDLEFVYRNDTGSALEGFHVDPNSEMLIRFMINNTGNTLLNLKIIINFTYTYHPEKSAFLKEKSVTLKPAESKRIELSLISPAKPTTYTPIITVFSGKEFLGELIGRLVVKGYGGSILDARTNKAEYMENEPVIITAEVTGSADYENEIEDVELQCRISDKRGNEILSDKKIFDLGLNPVKILFNKSAPKDFFDFTLFCSLSKDGRILDEFRSSYTGKSSYVGRLPEKDRVTEWFIILAFVPLVLTIIIILYIYKMGKKHEISY